MEVGAILKPEVLKALESVPDLYLILSPDFIIQTASDAYLEATFTNRENIRGKFMFDVFPDNPALPNPNGVANLRYSLEQVLTHCKPHQMAVQRYDVPKYGVDGGFEEKYWSPLNTPVLDDEGRVAYIIHKVTDVTEQEKKQHEIKGLATQAEVLLSRERAAHKEARMARSRLYNLFMQAPAVVNVLRGPELVFELANPPYCQAVGKDREIIGKPLTEAFPEIEPGLLEIHKKVYTSGERFVGKEFPVILDWDYNGEPYKKYYSFIYEPIRDDEGKVDGIMTFGYEVTDQVLARKQIENFLEQQQAEKQRLEAILNMMPSPLLLMDPDKQYLDEHITPQVIEKGKWEGEFRFRHIKTGELIPIHYNKFSIKDQETGEIKAFATVSTNITEQKQKQKELEKKNEELVRINNDLDAPVLNLEGLFYILFRKIELNEELAQLQSMIGVSFERFKNTLKDLTEVAKVNKGEEDTEIIEVVRFDDMLEEAKLTIKDQIDKSGAEIHNKFEVPAIRFSRKNLRSIIYNLVSNGVKYRSAERTPVINISTLKTANDYILLQVSDNGLGMNIQHKEKIFGMFNRLHCHVEGTGVGLYIVKRIVDNAGGKIEVESEVGKGTTLKLFLKSDTNEGI
jgi:signal transduction histidine kinase/PAS domain-containing protein